jgi:hypothetical protein
VAPGLVARRWGQLKRGRARRSGPEIGVGMEGRSAPLLLGKSSSREGSRLDEGQRGLRMLWRLHFF